MGIQNSTFTCCTNWIQKSEQGVLKSLALTLMMAMLFCTTAWSQNVNVNATGGTLMASYTTLKGAFDAVNAGTHGGVITIGPIVSNTAETAPATAALNVSGGTGTAGQLYLNIANPSLLRHSAIPLQRLLQRPAHSMIAIFNGADNVTIKGLNTGECNSLTPLAVIR